MNPLLRTALQACAALVGATLLALASHGNGIAQPGTGSATATLAAAATAKTTPSTNTALAATSARNVNHAHPAVTAWREAQQGKNGIDPNRFLVQPPATVSWTLRPADEVRLVVQR